MIEYLQCCRWVLNFSPVKTHNRSCYSLFEVVDKLCWLCSRAVLLLLGISRCLLCWTPWDCDLLCWHDELWLRWSSEVIICLTHAVYVLLLLLVITFSHLLSVNDLEWTSLLLAHMFHPLMTCNGNYNNKSGHLKQHAFMCWFVYMSDDVFIRSLHTYDQTRLMFISLSYVSAFSLFLYASMFYAWLIWSSWMLGDLYCQCHVFYALLLLIIIVDLCTCSMMSGCLIYVSCGVCLLIRHGVQIICPIIRYLYHVVFVSSSDQTNCSMGVVVGSNYIPVIFCYPLPIVVFILQLNLVINSFILTFPQ